MKCPACPETTLLMTERQGVEIDYCPSCRGVWLDRGELDKLIQFGAKHETPGGGHDRVSTEHRRRPDEDYDKRHYGYRRKHWLSEIFD